MTTQANPKKEFRAFKQIFNREEAEHLIYYHYRLRLCEESDTDMLEALLHNGLKKLSDWTTAEIQELLIDISEQYESLPSSWNEEM